MKKKYFILALLFAVMIPLFADEGGFTIKEYDFEGTLYENNVMSVKETIYVNFTEQRHGIFRSIPESFNLDRDDGKKTINMTYYCDIDNINTYTDNGSTSREDGVCTIKLGDADKYLEGDHVYNISYDVTIPYDRVKTGDFFYYSVLGSVWDTTIDKFSYKINFDKPIPSDTQFTVYSGSSFAETNELNAECNVTTSAVWGTVNNIKPNEAVTLFAELPEGFFVGAKSRSGLLSWIFCIAAIAMGLFTLYKIITTHQNEPVQTVEFYPPKDISPVDVGYIVDSSADDSDFIAMIPYWAQKGYLKIEEPEEEKKGKKAKLILHKLKDLPADAPKYQKAYFDALFLKGDDLDTSKISESQITGMDEAKTALKEYYTGDKALFTGSGKAKLLLFVTTVLACLGIGTTSYNTAMENLFLSYGPFILFFFGLGMNARQLTKRFSSKAKIIGKVISGAFAILIAYFNVTLLEGDCTVPLWLPLVTLAVLAVVSIFIGRMTTMTEYGSEVTGKLLGLKEFIKTAELPRLEVLMKENPGYYYDILPFATAYGLSTKWTNNFKGLTIEKPDWYVSRNPVYIYDPYVMQNSISNSISSTVDSVRAASSHSSSGGGGFSGGGGGGGGGGSW